MRPLKWLAVVALSGALAACASDIQRVRTAEGTGSPFTRALTSEYRDLSAFEADEMYDWPDARHFARKGLLAAEGEVVQPEDLGNWDLPEERVDELTAARAKLVGLLDAGARDRVSEAAARAQTRFDCWVEQQEENHQADHIAACRDQFFAALAELETAAPAPAQPAAVQPETYVVYFDFDRANIKPDAAQILDRAISDAKGGGTPSISVTGHADRSGAEDYNLGLSLRRADAVREYLINGGVTAEQITVSGRGEAEPAVPTADGVKEPRNRRVEIIVQ
jgi:OmpA-OmpF porin, OOP family